MSRSVCGSLPGETWARRARTRRSWPLAALVVAAVAAAACSSDTLYDTPPEGVGPPSVQIVAPVTDLEVQAGRSFRVHVTASDTLGINRLQLELSGATAGIIERHYQPPQLFVELDTTVTAPAGSEGVLEIVVRIRNTAGVSASAATIVRVALTDTIKPAVAVTAHVPERMELTDSLRVRVVAQDNEGGSGLVQLGFTALVVNTVLPDTFAFPGTVRDVAATAGVEVLERAFPPTFVNATALPDTLLVEIHAFAVDEAGNCAAVVTHLAGTLECRTVMVQGQQAIVGEVPGERIETVVVNGRSVALPAGATVADALPDRQRSRLYLSNLPGYRLEVLNLQHYRFESSVAVGAQPWGLAFNRQKDTVLVANSGGTSISSVALVGAPREVVQRRFHTPNLVLFELDLSEDTAGWRRIDARFYDFSDRPQFLAQDAEGRILFSTKPTPAAGDGTVRIAENQPGWAAPEVRLLLTGPGSLFQDGQAVAIGNIDSLRVWRTINGDDLIELFDHVTGFPNQIIRTGILPLENALDSLENHPGSNIVWAFGKWNRSRIGLSDTTFIAVSGDHGRIAIGEGATESGRVILWNAEAADISNEITTADLVGNTAERILGVHLNQDGTLGVARGTLGSYYFTDDLRLQGSDVERATPQGGAGAVLFPTHPTYRPFPLSGPASISFVATDQRTVKILDTVHFSERGEVYLRDNIVGPLRVSQPLPTDPCVQGVCPVAKLYGVTDAGAVVVIDVLPTHIRPPF